MSTAIVPLLLSAVLPVGTELHYTGTVSQPTANGNSTVKSFTVTVLIVPGEAGVAELLFQVEERGGGGWAWPERFGRINLGQVDGPSIRVLQTFDGNDYPLPIRRPVFEYLERLQPEASWTEGPHQYLCHRTVTHGDRECWLVEASLDRGRRQRIHVEKATGLVVSLEERLFLGRGDAFELKLQLESFRHLAPDVAAKNTTAAQALLELQRTLDRTEVGYRPELTSGQVELTAAALPGLKQAAADTGWQRLVDTIDRDLQLQRRRLDGVNSLVQKFVGQTVVLPDMKLVTGEMLKAADLTGQVVVLHFWEYPGEKMVEPYGQVGYLDFLNHRRAKLGVKVVGIAVDDRLKDPAQRGAAQRSIRKLQEFMNLSYPIGLDDGTLLKNFGDPRTLGSSLPLWVVIGGDGKITHYHVGHYNIQPDEGLKPLDAAVVQTLQQRVRN